MPSHSDRAMMHIRRLVEDIGPRPAGSQAEQRAFDYVASQLSRWGYQPARLPIKFSPLPHFNWPDLMIALALALGGWGLRDYPWLVVWLPLVPALAPQINHWLLQRRALTESSFNTIAYTSTNATQSPALVLCTHLDSAPASRYRSLFWLRRSHQLAGLIRQSTGALAILAAVQISGFSLPEVLVWVTGVSTSLAGTWLVFQGWRQKKPHKPHYTPGANDNASGAAVLLALAEYYAAHPPRNLRIGFLFTGAEETGLHGARAYARQLDPATTPTGFLSIDMVGAGNTLCYVSRYGFLFPRLTDPQLNQLVRIANPQAQELWHRRQLGDYAEFLQAGHPATGLQTSGSYRADIVHHTLYDRLDIIEPAALEVTAQTIIKMIHRIDQGQLPTH